MLQVVDTYSESKQLLQTFFNRDDIALEIQDKKNICADLLSGFGKHSRIDGSPYVGHLIGTHDNGQEYGEELYDRTLAQGLLLHDSPEDVLEHTVGYLADKYSFKTSLLVSSVTKPTEKEFWFEYRNDERLSSIWEITKRELGLTDSPLKYLNGINLGDYLDGKEWNIWCRFLNIFEKLYVEFTYRKFQDLQTLEDWFKEKGKGLINLEESKRLSLQSIVAKGSDRKHNLGTLPQRKSSVNKINETREWLGIVNEHFPKLGKDSEELIRTFMKANYRLFKLK